MRRIRTRSSIYQDRIDRKYNKVIRKYKSIIRKYRMQVHINQLVPNRNNQARAQRKWAAQAT